MLRHHVVGVGAGSDVALDLLLDLGVGSGVALNLLKNPGVDIRLTKIPNLNLGVGSCKTKIILMLVQMWQ